MSLAQTLPAEILNEILSLLCPPIDWDKRLRQDSHVVFKEMITGPAKAPGTLTPLKNASLVCKNWRRTAIRLLVRHVVWSFDRLEPPAEQDANLDEKIDFMAFLRRNHLTRCVQTLTIIVTYPEELVGKDFVQLWSHGILPRPNDGDQNIDERLQLAHKFHQGPEKLEPDEKEAVLRWKPWDNNWLWQYLFKHLDPIRITLLAPPANLCALVGCWNNLGDAWEFRYTYWALSLSLSKGASFPPTQLTHPLPPGGDETLLRTPCDLFSLRPWDSLLLNEGTSGLNHNDRTVRSHPTLLVPLLYSCDLKCNGTLLDTVESLTYIAVYPKTTIFGTCICRSLPPISELHLQVASDHPDAPVTMLGECRRFYSFIVGALCPPRHLVQGHWYNTPELQSIPAAAWQTPARFESGGVRRGHNEHEEIRYGVKFMRNIFDARARHSSWKTLDKGVLVRNCSLRATNRPTSTPPP
ncbi:aquaglyceroporin [Paramyrothecium foliicola]|nr:aquaglyceroporin [Paramyrothecium foliicola]